MTKQPLTTIPLKKPTRDRLAEYAGKDYLGAAGAKSYDTALNELLDIAEKRRAA